MDLITPDFGLLFWMVIIFGAVFFLLARFGFPIITGMVEKRTKKIEDSLRDAREIEARMEAWTQEHAKLIEQARREQADILREASETRTRIIADAKARAAEESEKIMAQTRTEIAAEKESAIMEIRKEVALLGVDIAEKVLRKHLSDTASDTEFLEQMIAEADRTPYRS